jgi:hypothetical protein
VAARGSSLIEDLIENARAFIAMSPKLREAVAKVDAQRAARASSIGAQMTAASKGRKARNPWVQIAPGIRSRKILESPKASARNGGSGV